MRTGDCEVCAEQVALPIALAVSIAVPAFIWWLFPQLELLEAGEAPRFRRLRRWILLAVAGTLVAIIIGALADSIL